MGALLDVYPFGSGRVHCPGKGIHVARSVYRMHGKNGHATAIKAIFDVRRLALSVPGTRLVQRFYKTFCEWATHSQGPMVIVCFRELRDVRAVVSRIGVFRKAALFDVGMARVLQTQRPQAAESVLIERESNDSPAIGFCIIEKASCALAPSSVVESSPFVCE